MVPVPLPRLHRGVGHGGDSWPAVVCSIVPCLAGLWARLRSSSGCQYSRPKASAGADGATQTSPTDGC